MRVISHIAEFQSSNKEYAAFKLFLYRASYNFEIIINIKNQHNTD
jgi:hypothetical protein